MPAAKPHADANLAPQMDAILDDVLRLAAAQGKLSGFCIGNTRKVNSTGLYFSPIRNTARMVAGSVIVYTVGQAEQIARHVDGKVDYILVDTEKKISPELYGDKNIGNVERAVREAVRCSRILTYKGNDLTVDAIENLIVQVLSSHPRGLSGKKAAIIGAGNIGAKLALKLVERGMDVAVSRRDGAKLAAIVEALNIIKPAETLARVTGTHDTLAAATGAHLLVGLTQGTPVITAAMVDALAPQALLLDGGKGCFFADAIEWAESRDLPIYRVDVRAGFEGHCAMALETERIVQRAMGRRDIASVAVISGGLLGRMNEVVVDNVHDPRAVFGMANGMGDFVRTFDAIQSGRMLAVRNYIAHRPEKP